MGGKFPSQVFLLHLQGVPLAQMIFHGEDICTVQLFQVMVH